MISRLLVATAGWLVSTAAFAQSMQVPSSSANGEGLPLWEVGVGVGGAWTPDYPGATSQTARGLPLPVVIYRGNFLRIGDGNVASGQLFQSDKVDFGISLNGSFDAESDDVGARAGMPDLGFVFEVGPEIEIQLAQFAEGTRRIELELPVRAAFSFDDDGLRDRGFVFNPELEYEHEFADRQFEWSISISPAFASERLQSYFFDVAPEFATADRPDFSASGGYLQTRLGLGLQWRGEGRFAAVGVSYAFLDDSTNEDSPLFRQDYGLSVGLVFVQRLWQSKRRVKARRGLFSGRSRDR
ncbi:MAG: MipA/OmpV family protein [Pseudomonadota bacterium]